MEVTGTRWRTLLRWLVLGSVLGLTAWNGTRSNALNQATARFDRRDYVGALAGALDHLDRRPWSRPAASLAACCFSTLDFAREAEPYYRRLRWTGPLTFEELHCRALGLTRANRREEAIAAYQEILRRDPDDTTALRRLAAVYYSRKELSLARELATRLTRIPSGAVAGFALLGTFDHEENLTEQAAEEFSRALELDPDLRSLPLPAWLFWNRLTFDLVASGRAAEVRRLLIRELSHHDEAGLHYNLGVAEESLGDMEAAEACWRRAVDRDPKSARAWQALGRLALEEHRPELAVERLRKAAALAPDDLSTVYKLALAYRQLGRREEAAECERKVEGLRRRRAAGSGPPPGQDPRP